MAVNLSKIHQQIMHVIEEANLLMAKGFTGEVEVFIKKGGQLSTSTLTQTDKGLSILYKTKLKELFPDFGFLTEESETGELKEDYIWVIDELDGTANFANKIPVFGTSVALWDMSRDIPVYGVVTFPIQKEIIHAYEGGGLYSNNVKVGRAVSKRPQISSVYAFVTGNKEKVSLIEKIANTMPVPENYRCAAFHPVNTALGRIDCAFFGGMPIWDIAAGLCIAKEAGLEIKYASERASLKKSNVREYMYWLVAAEKELSEKVSVILKEVRSPI